VRCPNAQEEISLIKGNYMACDYLNGMDAGRKAVEIYADLLMNGKCCPPALPRTQDQKVRM
jgi:hypothetical protein